MIDMGQADQTLRFTPSSEAADNAVFARHKQRIKAMTELWAREYWFNKNGEVWHE